MKTKLPKSLIGPFYSGYYDRSNARLYLKTQTGKYHIEEQVFPSLFVHKRKYNLFPYDAFPETFISSKEEGNYVRVYMQPTTTRDKVDEILHLCQDYECYPQEADVDPIRRWFSDTGATVASTTKALFFDLETVPDPEHPGWSDEAKRKHRILSISATDYQTKQTFFFLNIDNSDQGEVNIIIKFLDLTRNYDTILAWNGKDYDFFVLKERVRKHKIKMNWGSINLLDYMLVIKKCLMSISEPKFKRSFALDSVGLNVLGMKKLKVSVPMTQLYRLLNGREEELKAYNDRDVEIMVKLEEAREFLALHLAVCSLCRMFPNNNSLYPNALGDGLMLRFAIKENKHFKSRFKDIDEIDAKYTGAYVMEADIGFHQDIQVVDFASLYPSIMISWNMSPETKIWTNRNYPQNVLHEFHCTATATGIEFRTDFEGILPKAVRTLIIKRKEYAQKQKQEQVGSEVWKRYGHESTALKVVANSIYGLLGSQYSRYYDKDIAQSVTLTGQLLIRETIKFSQSKGYKVIAGDTDSCFIKASQDETKKLVESINKELIPQIIETSNCRVNVVKIDYDKGYKSLLIQAKKKYAGYFSLYKGVVASNDAEPDIKGLEFQRSDQIKYAQRMQMHFVHLLLDPKANARSIEKELRQWANKFVSEDIDVEDIVITQAISKHPTSYATPTPASKVAQKMIDSGKEFYLGQKIPYIVVDSKDGIEAIHADDYIGKFDRKYYWTNKILPPVQRLLEVRFQDYPFIDLVTLMKDPNQSSLDFGPLGIKRKLPMKKIKVKVPKSDLASRAEYTIILAKSDGIDTVKGISKIAKAYPGKYKLKLVFNLDNSMVTMPTRQLVSNEGIHEIKNLFPSIQISPEPI